MQTLHLRFRDLRAILLGVPPSRWPTPSMRRASTWKSALPLPCLGSARSAAKRSPGAFPGSCLTLPKPTCAVGSRPAVPVALIGTGPESGAVPRGRQRQRAIRFRASLVGDALPDRVCRAVLVRQTVAHPGDGPVRHRQHDRPPVGMAACLPVCAVACLHGGSAGRMPICMSACLPACFCPLPDR